MGTAPVLKHSALGFLQAVHYRQVEICLPSFSQNRPEVGPYLASSDGKDNEQALSDE